MAKTYNDLYLNVRRRLLAAGVEGAQIEAREIVCFASDKTREQFFRDMPLYTSSAIEERVEELALRRLAGEPVAYIIGEWEFYGIPLNVSQDVLIPRMDTEVLAERAILLARDAGQGARMLDLCTGSGCVGIATAANAENCRVILLDRSEAALRVARSNIRRTELNARVSCIRGDALAPAPANLGDYDVIACNPPYIPTAVLDTLDVSVKDYEPRMALDGGEDGLKFYRAVISGWKSALRPGGTLLFEVGYDQAAAVKGLLAEGGYTDISAYADTQGIWRVVSGRNG